MPREFFTKEYKWFRKDLKEPCCLPAVITILILALVFLGGGLAGMYTKTSPDWLFTTMFVFGVVIIMVYVFVSIIISIGYCCSSYCSSRPSFVEEAAEGV